MIRKTPDSEKMLERTFAEKVNKIDGVFCIKLFSTFIKGLPDRVVFFRGRALFVEFKTEGKKPTPMQVLIHDKLRKLGFECYVCDNKSTRDKLIDRVARLTASYKLEIHEI